MAEVVSAGTLVGSVLETVGYVTQERILTDFAGFLNITGAYLYCIAAVGAVFSVTLFGSYRMARYLLLGPLLFWILISDTSEVEPVYWTLGKKIPIRSDAALQGSLEQESPDTPEKVIKVATPFLLFTNMVSGISENVVSLILQYHDSEDYMFIDRSFAVETLMNAYPQKHRLTSILIEDLVNGCGEMMGAAMALSHNDVQEVAYLYHKEHATSDSDQATREQHQYRMNRIAEGRKGLQKKYCVGADKKIKPGPATRAFIEGYDQKYKYSERFDLNNPTAASLADQPISCGALWGVAQDAIMEDSLTLLENVESMILSNGSVLSEEDRAAGKTDKEVFCNAIAEKLGRDPSRDASVSEFSKEPFSCPGETAALDKPGTPPNFHSCNVVETVAAFMLRNMIIHLPYAETATNIKSRSHVNKSERRISPARLPGEKLSPEVNWANAQFRTEMVDGELVYQVLVNPGAKKGEKQDWRSFMIEVSDGHLDAGYIYHQRYQSNQLQQTIFSYALQLPYYQGCMLYLLSVAYPFMCLLVITPGHAARFLSYPLFWIWVKSWDIGFALVMVLEKILWNLLPNSKVDYNVLSNPDLKLPHVLEEAFKIDPSYDIHAHYNMVSMCLLSIPALTGYAIMKGRYSALASFTDGAREQADDAGGEAQGNYGVSVMDDKISMMKLTEGKTLRGVPGTQGQTGDGRGETAMQWALIRGGASFVKDMTALGQSWSKERDNFKAQQAKDPHLGHAAAAKHQREFMAGAIKGMSEGGKVGLKTYYDVLNKELAVDGYRELAYGSFKEHRKRQGAIFAVMDAFGEHELAHFLEGRHLLKAEKDRFMLKFGIAVDTAKDGLRAASDVALLVNQKLRRSTEASLEGELAGAKDALRQGKRGGDAIQINAGKDAVAAAKALLDKHKKGSEHFSLGAQLMADALLTMDLNILQSGVADQFAGDLLSGVKQDKWVPVEGKIGFKIEDSTSPRGPMFKHVFPTRPADVPDLIRKMTNQDEQENEKG